MKIEDFNASKTQTARIEFVGNGAPCFIDVLGIYSEEYASGVSFFKRASAQKIADGEQLLKSSVVMGEKVNSKTDAYKKLEAIQMAHVISSWSFDDVLTLDSAANFLLNNPMVVDKIDEKISLMAFEDSKVKKPQKKQRKQSSS